MNSEDRLEPGLASRPQVRAAEFADPGMLVIDGGPLFGEDLVKSCKGRMWRSAAKLGARGRGFEWICPDDGAIELIAVGRLWPKRRNDARTDVEPAQFPDET